MSLIERLLDLEIPQDIRISPDARHVLYATKLPLGHRKETHFRGTLWLAETEVGKSSRQITSGLHDDRSPQWCSRGDSIVFISDRAKPGQSCAIYLLPLSVPGGEAYPLTPAHNECNIDVFAVNPKGKLIAYVSGDEESVQEKTRKETGDDAQVWNEDWQFNRLRVVDVSTKKVTTLVDRPAHVTGDLAWNNDGTKIAFAEARTPDIENVDQYGTRLCIVDVATQAITEVCVFPKMLSNLVWAGNFLYFIAGVSTEDLVTGEMVWRIDMSGGAPHTYSQHAHGNVDCPRRLDKVGSQVVVSVKEGLGDKICLLHGETLLTRQGDVNAWDVVPRANGGFAVAASLDDINAPAEVFAVSATDGTLIQLSAHGGAIAEMKIGRTRFLTCKSADGTVDLQATFIQPKDSHHSGESNAALLPTLVHSHGGPYGRITDSFDPTEFMWSGVLLNAGYAMLFPMYRGSCGRGNDFASAILGAAGTVDYDDVITLTQHAINLGLVDKNRMIASGWSNGGFMTYLCTVRNGLHGHGWKFKGTIVGAGKCDADTRAISSDIGAYQDDLARKPPWRCDKTDISGRNASALWEFKAATDSGDMIPPMLILHGEKDERVPLDQAIAFRKAMTFAELPFQLVVYPREPHMFNERKHLVDLAGRVLAFVERHIGGKTVS